MYRALAWTAMDKGVSLSDGPALGQLATSQSFAFTVEESHSPAHEDGMQHGLHNPEVDGAASQVAQWPEVRDALVKQQRDIAAQGDIVMVGRDIGTKVAPQADLKVFLVASAETRARRRMLQGKETRSLLQIQTDMEARDRRDTQRSHSPLASADDAHYLDTEGLDPQQVVERIMDWLGGS